MVTPMVPICVGDLERRAIGHTHKKDVIKVEINGPMST